MPTLAEQVVLKEGDVFLLCHENGDVFGNTGLGLYYEDTRYVSRLVLKVNGESPPLLNFSGYRNFMGTFQYANDTMRLPDGTILLPQTLSIRRSRFISNGLHERIGIVNFNRFAVPISLTLTFGSDFRDIFDVRGFPREEWGQLLPPEVKESSQGTTESGTSKKLLLRYLGLDGIPRTTEVIFEEPPDAVEVSVPESTTPVVEPGIMVPVVGAPAYHIIIEPPTATVTWNLTLEPHTPASLAFHLAPRSGDEEAQPMWLTGPPGGEQEPDYSNAPAANSKLQTPNSPDGRFDMAVRHMAASYRSWDTVSTGFSTDNEEFNALLKRSKYDLRVLSEPIEMRTPGKQGKETGYFPSAGIPWYVCPFGRDSLTTALQTLSLNPLIAVGTLKTLATYQGTREDPWREEQPGKILHELRRGEMARLGMVPHKPYYGTVDATPLFVLLFVETMNWLNDDALYAELLPNVWRAIEWIDRYGDVDGDGLIEYVASTSHGGIRNQVWKDSGDSIQFPDGTLAETPIAAVEVQGYVYAAKLGFSKLLRRNGEARAAERLEAEANALKVRFNEQFWMPEERFFAQGLDKDKRPIPTITSNPGYSLWCGIADEEKARLSAQRMVQPDMLSGWGLRTISAASPSYNPMSYHNGSIWPHDNSLVAAGLKRYGHHDEANMIITQVVEAAQHFLYDRLPELYCGFAKDQIYGTGPAEYPVSCSPQAWAAAAPVLMLQTLLGLRADASQNLLHVNPKLPDWLKSVTASSLRVGAARVDLHVERHGDQYEVALTRDKEEIRLEVT